MKKIKNILQTLNLFGKNKRYVYFDTTNTPASDHKKTFTINWIGDRLIVSLTQGVQIKQPPSERKRSYNQIKNTYTDGGTETIEVMSDNTINAAHWIENNKLFFDCTNVTSLIVNGETLI